MTELSIDKSNWTKVKFGDVVFEPKESVKDARAEGIEHVVGLEHIDSEDIHLRRSNSIDESTTFTKKFSEGDVLFGRRRAYLKKAAQASFSGICSGDITVMRANEKLLPELLPFLVNNDKFFDWAVQHSAGGLSPRVKFKDLAGFELTLPPYDQQRQISKLLLSMDSVIESEKSSLLKADKLKHSYFINSLFDKTDEKDKVFGYRKSKHRVNYLGDLITEMQYGISESLNSDPSNTPVLRMNNLQNGKLDLSDLKYFEFSESELEKYKLDVGDVLFNRTNSYELVGKVSLFDVDTDADVTFASYLIRIKADKSELDSRFLNAYLNSSIGMSKIRKYRTPGVSQSNINAQNLKRIPVPNPDIEHQKELMDVFDKLDESVVSAECQIIRSKYLQKSLCTRQFRNPQLKSHSHSLIQ